MLNCQEATRLMSEAQEHPLPLAATISLRTHLLLCSGCRNFGRHLDVLRQASRAFTQGAGERADATSEADQDTHRGER